MGWAYRAQLISLASSV
ncbi:hypothetical protein HID58_049348 [Brassica napus]|uniref:Uncharacterized protein n=1 Tax=Brassica napus TaxID=3708 RepID=A0ABQ8B4S2_BRANA|nr:hypothetical protein HID58_049348 [Brassica napus]